MRRIAYILAMVLATGAVAYFVWREKRFSLPAPVHKAHRSIEGDCFACHDEKRGISNARCSGCHEDPATGRVVQLEGFARHHAYADLKCTECHTEHRGADGSLTKRGHAFKDTDCSACHERHMGPEFAYALPRDAHPQDVRHASHAGLMDDCFACHDEGRPVSADKCSSCHQEESTRAKIALAGYGTHPAYDGLDCLHCHTEHRGSETALKRPAPDILKSECAVCHARHVGEDFAYKLRTSEHPERTVHGDHARWREDCSACHVEGRGLVARQCTSCHDPETEAKVKFAGFASHHLDTTLDCLECHEEHRGLYGDLTKPTHTLERVGCGRCHEKHMGKDYAYVFPRTHHPKDALHADHARWQSDCFVCHTEAGGLDARKCTTCHDPKTREKVKFPGFAAHHAYEELKCLDCHVGHRGRDGTLLRAGKSFKTMGCKTCHERHVGPAHSYTLAGERHPEGRVHRSHAKWESNCFACHKRDTGKHECITCHDPATGKQVELEGFASHHFLSDLKCLDCHAEHQGKRGATTKPGAIFAKTACETCHEAELKRPSKLDEIPAAVRGKAALFDHEEHPAKALTCAQCHPMKPTPAHALVGPFDKNCSACHHDPEQKASCAKCHRETADYFAGRIDGGLVPRGTHGRSDEVTCADCHKFDQASSGFRPPESTCAACHPKSYTELFARAREPWQRWRKKLEARPAGRPDAKRLQFIARNWYHNDAHAEKVRKTHGASKERK